MVAGRRGRCGCISADGGASRRRPHRPGWAGGRPPAGRFCHRATIRRTVAAAAWSRVRDSRGPGTRGPGEATCRRPLHGARTGHGLLSAKGTGRRLRSGDGRGARPTDRRSGQEPLLHGEDGHPGPGSPPGLVVDVPEVMAHGAARDGQLRAYLMVGHSPGGQAQYLDLPRREPRRTAGPGGPSARCPEHQVAGGAVQGARVRLTRQVSDGFVDGEGVPMRPWLGPACAGRVSPVSAVPWSSTPVPAPKAAGTCVEGPGGGNRSPEIRRMP